MVGRWDDKGRGGTRVDWRERGGGQGGMGMDVVVPLDPPANTDHVNTVQGIAHVRLLAAQDDFLPLSRQITTVFGAHPVSSGPAESTWTLQDVPAAADGVDPGHSATSENDGHTAHASLILSVAQSDAEKEYVRTRGAGIYEVGFLVEDGRRPGEDSTPYGRVVWTRA
ncbi:hypothetical protein OBBRIDRAFT_805489 [Obba rivulosa]|uniref:Uncharacterized protein n=1 Tax=Obba rivulosa TaxID=1052685 RepID=A0A8E2DMM7_9APHY|nr:hypothetical protein OBBRIDRAFT_805489 [Obba rivulosa]